jgi:hypothetical protein
MYTIAMATNSLLCRGLKKPISWVILLVHFVLLAALAAPAQTPPAAATLPAVTDAEVTAFMQAHQKDPKALLTIRANPKRVPLLLGAIKRDPAGFWPSYLHGACFIDDRANAGRQPAAVRAKTYAGAIEYLSTAQATISKALQKSPQNRGLTYNLELIDKDLALIRADAAAPIKDTRSAIPPGSVSNTVPRGDSVSPGANSAPAQRAKVCGANLTQIDLAKEMWQLDYNKPPAAIPSAADLAPYLPYRAFPKCPDGGTYAIGKLNQKPACSFPGHILPPRPKLDSQPNKRNP